MQISLSRKNNKMWTADFKTPSSFAPTLFLVYSPCLKNYKFWALKWQSSDCLSKLKKINQSNCILKQKLAFTFFEFLTHKKSVFIVTKPMTETLNVINVNWYVGNALTVLWSSSLPTPPQELPRFKELIFEDFSRFLLVENMFEEVVLQSVSKDIIMGEDQ